MTKRICSEDGCTRPHDARGLCKMHWKRWRKNNVPSGRAVIPLADRLQPRVDVRGPDDCWPWTGQVTRKGYGKVKVGSRTKSAHRVAYEVATGVDPGDLFVLHRCDNPPCCNPAHLFLGTHLDNMADMVAKGRQNPWGRRSPHRTSNKVVDSVAAGGAG